MPSADTPSDAHDRQIAVYRSMTPGRRLEVAVAMSEEVFTLAAAGIGARHPSYDQAEVGWALRRLRLGDEVFTAVWPDAPLLAP